jgi:hypothetical protein
VIDLITDAVTLREPRNSWQRGERSSSREKKLLSAAATAEGRSSGKKCPPSTGSPVTSVARSRHGASGDHGVRGRADQAFGQRLWLGQQRPRPEREREAIVGAATSALLREPVQQQDGRSRAAAAHADDSLASVDTQFLQAAHRLNRNAREYPHLLRHPASHRAIQA